MAGRTLDTLIVDLLFRGDTKGLENANRKMQEVDRKVQAVVRGMQVAFAAALGLGGVAFVTGSKIERELLNLRTQLGETEESVEAVKPALEALSSETAVPLDRLAAGFFALRSAGLSTEAALETLTASAFGVNAGMGDIRDIAFTAGGAVNAYGEDAMSGARATDILLSTVEKGSLIASDLTRGFGELLQVAPELGVEMEQLGAIIAKATPNSVSANVVMTQLRQILFGLLRPTAQTAKKQFEALGIDAGEFARRVDEDLIGALQWLRQEAGEDREAFSRLFESQEAVGLMFSITGDKASDYREALDAIQNSTGATNRAHEIWAQSGLAQAEKGVNETKLTLNNLYENAVVPLLQLFGKLNSVLQQFIIVLGVASIASAVLGGPSLGKLIGAIFTTDWSVKLLSIQLKLLTVQTWLSNAAAKALASGKWLLNAATTALTLSFWRNLASMAALRIGMLAGAVATGVATAAQWALNAAMWANPIGLIILGIVALIATLGAVAYAIYRFRDTIVGAFKTAWNWIKDNWPLLLAIITGPIGLAVLGIILFKDDIIGAFADVRDFIIGAWRAVVDFIVDKFNMVKDLPGQLLDAIPGGGLIRQAAGLLGFSEGGIVPGPLGKPHLAMLHGGEMVLPVEATNVLARMMNGFAAGPNAILPVAPAGAASSTMETTNRSVSIEISGPININVPEGADGREIAQSFREALRDELENLVRDSDSNIAR